MNGTEQRLAAIEAHDAEITERLQGHTREIQAHEDAIRALQQQRARIMTEASDVGWSHERIGATVGLSKQRIGQLVKEFGS